MKAQAYKQIVQWQAEQRVKLRAVSHAAAPAPEKKKSLLNVVVAGLDWLIHHMLSAKIVRNYGPGQQEEVSPIQYNKPGGGLL